jgi:hypothetical protein
MWPGPITARVSLATDTPRAFVWRAFEAARRWPEVLPDLESAAIEPDDRLAVGAVMRSRAVPGTMAVDMAYHVLVAEAPARLVTDSRANGFRARTDYRFADADGGGTTITFAANVTAERKLMRAYISLQRGRYSDMVEASLRRRMQAMLVLAEKLWQEDGSAPPPTENRDSHATI